MLSSGHRARTAATMVASSTFFADIRGRLHVHDDMSEFAFAAELARYATAHGWMCHWDIPAHRGGMLRTQSGGDNGYPDLTLGRDGIVIHAELKVKRNVPDDNQRAWATALGESYRLWYPADADHIIELLT